MRAVSNALLTWMFRAAFPPGSREVGAGEMSEGSDDHECTAEVSSAFAAAGT